MSDTKQQVNWLPWIVVGVLGFMLWQGQKPLPTPGPQPEPVPVVSVEKEAKQVFAKLKSEYVRIFSEAADNLEKGLLKTDKELFEIIRPATETARKKTNQPFSDAFDLSIPRNEDGTFAGKEKEAAAFLRRVARSW